MKIDIEDSKVRAAVERLRGKKEIKILFVCLGNTCRRGGNAFCRRREQLRQGVGA